VDSPVRRTLSLREPQHVSAINHSCRGSSGARRAIVVGRDLPGAHDQG
jgi:hypothetical protein